MTSNPKPETQTIYQATNNYVLIRDPIPKFDKKKLNMEKSIGTKPTPIDLKA